MPGRLSNMAMEGLEMTAAEDAIRVTDENSGPPPADPGEPSRSFSAVVRTFYEHPEGTTGCIVGVVPQHAPFNWNVATFFICKSKPGAQFNVVPFQLESLPQDEAAVILGALEDQPQFLVYENGQRAVLERSDSEKFFEALKTATPYFDEYAMGSAIIEYHMYGRNDLAENLLTPNSFGTWADAVTEVLIYKVSKELNWKWVSPDAGLPMPTTDKQLLFVPDTIDIPNKQVWPTDLGGYTL